MVTHNDFKFWSIESSACSHEELETGGQKRQKISDK